MESRRSSRDRSTTPWQGWIGPLLVAGLLLVAVQSLLFDTSPKDLPYSEFKRLVSNRRVKNLTIGETEIRGDFVEPVRDQGRTYKDFRTRRHGLERDDKLIGELDRNGIDYSGEESPGPLRDILLWLLASASLILLLYYFVFRKLGAGGTALTFGRSRARLYAQEDLDISFEDVAGIDEAVEELREVVDFLKTPEKYQQIGGRIPKGVLLVGPPGTGKTLLAKAVAGEAGVPFFGLSGSDFVEMFVGVGAARVRDLFAQAEHHAPCIIFIDELDALGKTRGSGYLGGHDEREQTLNQLLVEMDGFDSNRGVIIMAATNRPETLDPALLRAGRFDRTVVVDRPDVNGREAILRVHARNVKVAEDLALRSLASLTPGFVGADLANLVNEAALLAAREGRPCAARKHFEEAIERVMAGLERKQRVILPEEKRRIAYHECGHAILAYLLPSADPVHKISIIPRGVGALGYTLQRPVHDRYLATQTELEHRICTLLGGITAEELVYPDISTGAQNDLERVTQIARSMVKDFGMSGKLGRVSYGESDQPRFLAGARGGGSRDYSERTAFEIDQEVKRIIDSAANLAREILAQHRDVIEQLANRLLEREVLQAEELEEVMQARVPRLVPGTAVARRLSAPEEPAPGVTPAEEGPPTAGVAS